MSQWERREVALISDPNAYYPTEEYFFSPAAAYPEYPYGDIANAPNPVYDMVRQTFVSLGLDKANYGTAAWNPLADMISQGDTVLVKPNWVSHVNAEPKLHDMSCMVTHPSLIRAVVDYVALALKGTGRIIVADAPVQGCDFDALQEKMHYNMLWRFYEANGVQVEHFDMRGRVAHHDASGNVTVRKDEDDGIVVRVDEQSCFAGCDEKKLDSLRITNYPTDTLKLHHNGGRHEYSIHRDVLNADVIINLAKPKAHRKAGMTACLKNMVGTCVRKEYLPHHAKGSCAEGGDEYRKKNFLLRSASDFLDRRNDHEGNTLNRVYGILFRGFRLLDRLVNRERFFEGSWYGNDTIWRTIVDLNKIIRFADKNGKLRSESQRKMLCLTDMIVSGEKEGPLMPSPKHLGVLVAGTDPVSTDLVVSRIFGFDWKKLKYLKYMMETAGLREEDVTVYTDDKYEACQRYPYNTAWAIEPTGGWKGHIEQE